jgi:hypothetical protein
MSTKLLMRVSAIFLGLFGVGASFLPQEVLAYFDFEPIKLAVILIQIVGGLYLGFAILNWTARDLLLGGIYNRPVVIGNFLHFAVVTIVLVKSFSSLPQTSFIVAGIVYLVLAVWFGVVLFTHPAKRIREMP